MDLEETIRIMEETLSQLRKFQWILDSNNDEVKMWRKRYLASVPLEDVNPYIRTAFLYMPSEAMMKTTPEKIIKDLQEFQRNKNEG